MSGTYYQAFLKLISEKKKGLAILIDPDKFEVAETVSFLSLLPKKTTHLFVGGSTVENGETGTVVSALKKHSELPVFLFPGNHNQITSAADALLFLSLLSGRNAEYLVGQQVKSVPILRAANLEIIPTGYVLLEGGNKSAVARVSKTQPISQSDVDIIVDTSLAGQYMGAKCIYLEAGSGASFPVRPDIIQKVKKELNIPLIVGGGIRSKKQMEKAYAAGADMIVMGTAFENKKL